MNLPITTKTTCPYCGVGCGVVATRTDDHAIEISGDAEHPANRGRLCSKGSALGETLDHSDRLLHPRIGQHEADWDTALTLIAQKFADAVDAHGPNSVAMYVSGQLLTEDYYVANKWMKGFIGSANIDTNSRLCMASSVAGHKRAFGSDTVPGVYDDIEQADLVVLVGSNLAWCHPVLFQRLADARTAAAGSQQVVLIDPRRTATASIADHHLAIKPDGDCALFMGLLSYLEKANRIDQTYVRRHTDGLDDALAACRHLTLENVTQHTGLTAPQVESFYSLFADNKKVVTIYSQGVNQSRCGTDKVNAIINCHLATGRIGREGMGPFSITGQPNAMGGREVGGLANMLAAHMELDNEGHRETVQSFWSSPTIASQAGLKAVDLFRAIHAGDIKALWIMATNPVDSVPESTMVEQALINCPFVVVSDVVSNTDTVRHADVALPSAAWGEKDGTVTNSERCVSRQRAFLTAPGKAKSDWWQIAQVARRMGFEKAFDYTASYQIFQEHAALSCYENAGKRDFDIGYHAHCDARSYDELTPFYWPFPATTTTALNHRPRFFSAGKFYRPNRKAHFVAVNHAADPVTPAAGYPLTLNTGRIRDQWHTMTRTGKSQRLSTHLAEPFCEIHPADATRLKIVDASIVRVSSSVGSVILRALITTRVREGSVFAPMHWTDQFAASARVNRLIHAVTDPVSGQPAFKNVAVRVEPANMTRYAYALTRRRPTNIQADYWAISRISDGWQVEAASTDANHLTPALLATTLSTVRPVPDVRYDDDERNQTRSAWFDGNSIDAVVYVANEPVGVSRSWAVAQFDTAVTGADRCRLVAGSGPKSEYNRGAIICVCFSVGVNDITRAIKSGCVSTAAIGQRLQAGTNCGSCRGEIADIINSKVVASAKNSCEQLTA